MTEQSIQHVIQLVREQGSGCWWTSPVEALLPPELRDQAASYRRGEDTMDVWFDSGSSWAGVLQGRGAAEGLNYPADLYLEGSDQHRGAQRICRGDAQINGFIEQPFLLFCVAGWFQSSLLTSVAANGIAPYRQVQHLPCFPQSCHASP